MRTGVLVIRVWIEEGSDDPLRARITHTVDVAAGDETSSGAADEQTIVEEVSAWLRDFRAQQ